ncbi:hypothetical protein POTOM_033300 [Populus tomentosa]|uniref:Uncharacterized protein n=1 Tax=Populus tomentosa TaxID=118781 RepID=A0A8X7Z444_POPTO|nr:hypothetical protein POTOM_033300 [Populus tomentosa]
MKQKMQNTRLDLLVSLTRAGRIGYLDDPYILPCAGNDADGPTPCGELAFPLEAYDSRNNGVALVQQRSPVVKEDNLPFEDEAEDEDYYPSLPFAALFSCFKGKLSVMECSSPTGPRELQQSGMLVNVQVFNWELQEVESEFPGSWYHQFFPSLTGRPTVLQLLHNEDRLFLSFLGFESDISMVKAG